MSCAGAGSPSAQRRLAERVGILPRYVDAAGVVRETSDATRCALLAAVGLWPEALADAVGDRGDVRSLPTAGPGPRAGRAVEVGEVLGEVPAFGIWANLYSLRGERDIGVGTLGDVRRLVRLAAATGAAFVGLSPLHATRNRPPEVSPYSGTSRIFRNPIYLDPAAIPEVQSDPRLGALVEARHREVHGDRVDYAGTAVWQRAMLEAALPAFLRGRAATAEFVEFRARDGGLAVDFATFQALEDAQNGLGGARDWRAWPAALRDPRSDAVAEFRAAHRGDVDLHLFAQFELERQLGECAGEAARQGLALGLYQDVAVGCAASGFDAWCFGEQLVLGASLGAPPDPYCLDGQDWGIPPVDPQRLAADDYRYFRLVVRSACTHAGAVRIDHAMGLERQFWVPVGLPAAEGAYVRQPARGLFGVVVQESRRSGCVVIAEDLGTVPRGFGARLARAGMLSSRVMLFERTPGGGFRSARCYSPRALVTANTHDHPTLAAWWGGHDLELRRSLGLPVDPEASRGRDRERRLLLRRLRAEGVLTDASENPDFNAVCGAVYAFLGRTAAPLVGVSLDDLAGETTPVNIPGVPQDVYPSWTRRMRWTVDELAAAARVRDLLAAVRCGAAPPAR